MLDPLRKEKRNGGNGVKPFLRNPVRCRYEGRRRMGETGTRRNGVTYEQIAAVSEIEKMHRL